MIDTIRIKSPYIAHSLYNEIKQQSFKRYCLSPENDIMYEFTNQELLGSYDSKIMLKTSTEDWKKIFSVSDNKWRLSLVDSEPYIEIEFSIHKFFLGHNVYGGSNDLIGMLLNFEQYLNNAIGFEVPSILEWDILRLDYAEVFKIDFIKDFLYMMNNSNYPRRNVVRYPDSIYVTGTTTTLKMYNKKKEFLKHDRKRLKDTEFYDDLVDFSDGILRVEVEVKKKKFNYDFGRLLKVKEYEEDYFINLYEKEVSKIMNVRTENEIICKYKDVQDFLHKNLSPQMARSVMSTYSSLSLLGELETKSNMSKTTYYKHRKILLDNNISWENSDLRLDNKVIKFVPLRDSKYRLKTDCIKAMLLKAI